MNIYDMAHQLAQGLKESPEYKEYKRLKDKIKEDKVTKDMLKDFRQRQMTVEMTIMQGKEVSAADREGLNKLHELMMTNPAVAELLTAEMRLGTMLTDIQKIIGQALDVWSDLEE